MSQRTAVYRFFDSEDRLLYVGITYDLLKRWGWHQRNSSWWSAQERVAVAWYADRESAELVEAIAIRDESPIHNVAAGRGLGAQPVPEKEVMSTRVMRFPPDLWSELQDRAKAEGVSVSALIRDFTAWWTGVPGAELPKQSQEVHA